MANTGYKHYTTRKQVMLDPSTGLPDASNPTGYTEANADDADYIADEYDVTACPIPVTVYSQWLGITNQSTPCDAQISAISKYKDTSGTAILGTTFYNESPGITKYNGGGYWHKVPDGGTYNVRIGTTGVVLSVTTCP